MLFGAFFTAYFFVRVVNGTPWPTPPYHLPVYVAFINTCILVTSSFTMHWALQSVKRGNVFGLRAGLLLTFLMGLTFLITQAIEYSRIGFNTGDGAFATIFFCLRPARAHVFVGPLDPALHDDPRLPRALLAEHHTASRSAGSTGTSST